jgi:hypothetical protein
MVQTKLTRHLHVVARNLILDQDSNKHAFGECWLHISPCICGILQQPKPVFQEDLPATKFPEPVLSPQHLQNTERRTHQ